MDGIELVFSSIGISRQRDGLTFEEVDYQCNKNLIDLCQSSGVNRFVYVSMQGAENIMQPAIIQAHEKVVTAGEIDGVGPERGRKSLRSYFEGLHAGDPNP